jgi:Pentapeptide repeats (9 copies)
VAIESHVNLVLSGREAMQRHYARGADPQDILDVSGTDWTRTDPPLSGLASLDFRTSVNFSGSTFPDGFKIATVNFVGDADFSKCTFLGFTEIGPMHCGKLVRLAHSTFHGALSMTGVSIGSFDSRECVVKGQVRIVGSIPGGVLFRGSLFDSLLMTGEIDRVADFSTVVIKKECQVSGHFACTASFAKSNFPAHVNFKGARFSKGASFGECLFRGSTNFTDATFGSRTVFDRATFSGPADFSGTTDNNPFKEISFRGCLFSASFAANNREFQGSTDFSDATFRQPPQFHNSRLHQDTSFDVPAKIDGIGSDSAERCFRTLKLAMSEHQAHREELMFFALEMEARRLRERNPWVRCLMFGYKHLSDYGRGIALPLLWLVAVVFAWLFFYAWTVNADPISQCVLTHGCRFLTTEASQLLQFTLAQSVPFLSLFKDTSATSVAKLFPGGVPLGVQLLALAQGLLTILFAFLVGLGLRNLFRLK